MTECSNILIGLLLFSCFQSIGRNNKSIIISPKLALSLNRNERSSRQNTFSLVYHKDTFSINCMFRSEASDITYDWSVSLTEPHSRNAVKEPFSKIEWHQKKDKKDMTTQASNCHAVWAAICRLTLLYIVYQILSLWDAQYVVYVVNEPQHDKTNKMTSAQRKLRSAWTSGQSDQSLRCVREETMGP